MEGPERRRTRRRANVEHKYEKANIDEVAPMGSHHQSGQLISEYDPYNPYHGPETSENTLYSRGGY
jgi:hypothetical protein